MGCPGNKKSMAGYCRNIPSLCTNCQGDHTATFPQCPATIKAMEILQNRTRKSTILVTQDEDEENTKTKEDPIVPEWPIRVD